MGRVVNVYLSAAAAVFGSSLAVYAANGTVWSPKWDTVKSGSGSRFCQGNMAAEEKAQEFGLLMIKTTYVLNAFMSIML